MIDHRDFVVGFDPVAFAAENPARLDPATRRAFERSLVRAKRRQIVARIQRDRARSIEFGRECAQRRKNAKSSAKA